MAAPAAPANRRRKLRYVVGGKTAFFVSESSSGLIAGLGDLAPDDVRRFHLTSIRGEKGFESHISDQRGEQPRVRVPPTPLPKMLRRLKRLIPFIHKYRWNEVAWLPIGPMAERIDAINRPERLAGRDVIPLERMRKRITVDLWDPTCFRKVRLSELAALGKPGYRYKDGVLHLVLAAKDGVVLTLPTRRVRGLLNIILEAGGLEFGAYFAHVDRHWPDIENRRPSYPRHGQRRPRS